MNLLDIQIEATTRDLGRRLTATGLGHSVRLRRRFDAPIEAVWAAITEPAQLKKWEGRVSGDLRAGVNTSSRATRTERSSPATGRITSP